MLFRLDNMTCVFVLIRQATRIRRPPASCARSTPSRSSNISIDAVHRSGERITLADFLSRPELHDSDVTAAWRTAHPDRVSDIMSLSAFLVCSLQLGD